MDWEKVIKSLKETSEDLTPLTRRGSIQSMTVAAVVVSLTATIARALEEGIKKNG